MIERGIIFSGPMVLAILEGRKTQTRRLATSPALRRVVPGDRLYVRETFRHWRGSASGRTAVYSADDRWHDFGSGEDFVEKVQWLTPATPSIHMPRWASRLNLSVTGVRVEPLQAITREDCVAEGHPRSDAPYPEEVHLDAARDWYMDLWDSLHPKQRFASNPEVLVLTFEVEK